MHVYNLASFRTDQACMCMQVINAWCLAVCCPTLFEFGCLSVGYYACMCMHLIIMHVRADAVVI